MSDFQAPGLLLREALTDAPDGEWLDQLLENLNQSQRQTIKSLRRGLTTEQNTVSREKELNLAHGIEIPCANPLDVPIRGVYALRCDGLTLDSLGAPTGSVYDLDTPTISWRPNPSSTSGGVLVKAVYPAPVGACRVKTTIDVSIPKGVPTEIAWNAATQNGDISWVVGTPTKVVCAVAGIVSVGYGLLYDTAAGGYRESAALLNSSAASYYAYDLTPGGTYAGVSGNDEITVAAGDYLTLTAYQNQTAAAALNLLSAINIPHFAVRYVAPPSNTVGRVNLFFYGG